MSRAIAVVLVFAWELAWGLVVATPVHAWVKQAWGAHPDGDAVLFEPGGRALVLMLGNGGDAMGVVVATVAVLLVAGAVLGQVPLGALVAALARRTRFVDALATGVRAWLPLSAVLVIAGVVQGVLLAIGGFAGSALDHALRDALGDARAFGARLVVLAVFVAIAAVVGIVADLARVAVVRDLETAPAWTNVRAGIGAALRTTRRSFGGALGGWAWRAALAAALLGAAWMAGGIVGGRGGAALVALFVFRQLMVLGRTALRASWLAHALRLVPEMASVPSLPSEAVVE